MLKNFSNAIGSTKADTPMFISDMHTYEKTIGQVRNYSRAALKVSVIFNRRDW
jgi:hypothetical protein|tara:strand:- start:41 stop:199 length:159 start_codon:yes stop_codon:yes gene_type:complete